MAIRILIPCYLVANSLFPNIEFPDIMRGLGDMTALEEAAGLSLSGTLPSRSIWKSLKFPVISLLTGIY